MRIEIKGFLETSFVDWPGKICSVLFLPRCNFRCPYCHNAPLLFHPEHTPSIPLRHVLKRLHSLKKWIDGVCLTGGEPTLHADLPLLASEFKRKGLLVKLDTNGSNPQRLEQLIQARGIDFVSMDVKAPLHSFSYRRAAGFPVDLNLIRKSIDILKRGEVEYQFRMTVVPGLHREEDAKRLGEQLRAGSRFILQNFNPASPLVPSLNQIRPYDPGVLKKIEKEVQQMV
jgi:pyruvate formate lyase activating enzyme